MVAGWNARRETKAGGEMEKDEHGQKLLENTGHHKMRITMGTPSKQYEANKTNIQNLHVQSKPARSHYNETTFYEMRRLGRGPSMMYLNHPEPAFLGHLVRDLQAGPLLLRRS